MRRVICPGPFPFDLLESLSRLRVSPIEERTGHPPNMCSPQLHSDQSDMHSVHNEGLPICLNFILVGVTWHWWGGCNGWSFALYCRVFHFSCQRCVSNSLGEGEIHEHTYDCASRGQKPILSVFLNFKFQTQQSFLLNTEPYPTFYADVGDPNSSFHVSVVSNLLNHPLHSYAQHPREGPTC